MVQHAVLEFRIIGFAKRSSQGEITKKSSGRGGAFDLLANGAQGQRHQTGGFKDMSQRTHGTRAKRSDRGKEDNIHPLVLEQFGSRWAAVHAHRAQVKLVTRVREMGAGHLADLAVRR